MQAGTVNRASATLLTGSLNFLSVVGSAASPRSDRRYDRDSAVPIGEVVLKNERRIGLSNLSTNGDLSLGRLLIRPQFPEVGSGEANRQYGPEQVKGGGSITAIRLNRIFMYASSAHKEGDTSPRRIVIDDIGPKYKMASNCSSIRGPLLPSGR